MKILLASSNVNQELQGLYGGLTNVFRRQNIPCLGDSSAVFVWCIWPFQCHSRGFLVSLKQVVSVYFGGLILQITRVSKVR